MKATCQPIAGICSQCRQALPANVRRTCPAWLSTNPQQPSTSAMHQDGISQSQCMHLGNKTGKEAKVACGKKARYIPVYQCAVHRLCTPQGISKDHDLIRPCHGPDGICQDFLPVTLTNKET